MNGSGSESEFFVFQWTLESEYRPIRFENELLISRGYRIPDVNPWPSEDEEKRRWEWFPEFLRDSFQRRIWTRAYVAFPKKKKKKNFLNDANSSVENIYIFIETCLQKEIRSSTKNSFVEMNNPHTRDEKRSFRASLVARTQGAPSTKLFLNRARVEEPTRVIA